ncbi:PspC domain-containing protein [Butyrivibrio sp. AE3004]|uniref:PspC domain-containing protein n=1 Tax=Butyrivibrio sp. AE3004 TaxID=1506994 RepID=UPI000A6069AA|nr:PspC domain-containing protein [Butyrivibrio sp. AE3004]
MNLSEDKGGLYSLYKQESIFEERVGADHRTGEIKAARKVSVMNGKRLYKSNDKRICGVCGGIAEYFGIDPVIVRLIWGILAFAWGTSIAVYIVLAFIMDDAPDYIESNENGYDESRNIEEKTVINAEPVGFRLNNGVKEEIYR